MTIKLIVSDMDETFLRADKIFDEMKAERIFKELAEKGVVLAIASGNFVPLLERYFSNDSLKNLYLAGDDGNVLKGQDGIERKLPLEATDSEAIFNFFQEKAGYYLIFSTGEQAYVYGNLDEGGDRQISLYYGDYILIREFSEIPSDEEIVKIEMYCEHPLDEIKVVMKEIKKTCLEYLL